MMMYNQIIEDCFFFPRHIGTIDLNQPGVVCQQIGQSNQELMIALYMQCRADGLVEKACFKAVGSPYVIAGLEWVCRLLQGNNVFHLPIMDEKILTQTLGIPSFKSPVALQINSVFHTMIQQMKQKIERY